MDFTLIATVVDNGYTQSMGVRTHNGPGTPVMTVDNLLMHAKYLVEEGLKRNPDSQVKIEITY